MLETPLLPNLTDCGIPGIEHIPYGVHFCHFYPSKEDLINALVPFFIAGLENNERCIWVSAAPFPAREAKEEIRARMPDADDAMRDGRLRILDASEWYGITVGMTGEQIIGLWLQEEETALAKGFQGIRVTGNTSFLTPETWPAFMAYEGAVAKAFAGRRIVALCSYDPNQCYSDHAEVMKHHQFTLKRAYENETWQVVDRS